MNTLHAIYEVIQIEKKKTPDTTEILDKLRNVLEPYIYFYLIEKHGAMLQKFWESYQPPWISDNVFVIAERRAHPNFRFILQNIAWAGPDMAVYIYCSDENQAFIEAILGDKREHYHIIPVFSGNPTREEGKQAYNTLLTDYRFYQTIQAKYMLTVQLDNIIRKKIDPAMFTGDYWGNPWSWDSGAAGGGGATVRNISAMIELCRVHRVDLDAPFNDTEDKWISDRIINYPDESFRSHHLMESVFVDDPHILHQFWTFGSDYLVLPREAFAECWRKLLTIE